MIGVVADVKFVLFARRLARQVITEGLVLSMSGGAAGLCIAFWTLLLLVRFAPNNLPRLSEIGLNWRVTAFVIPVTVATPLVFCLGPLANAVRSSFVNPLRGEGRTATQGRSQRFIMSTAVVVQFSLAFILLTTAGLLTRRRNTERVDMVLCRGNALGSLGVLLLRGRLLGPEDQLGEPRVAVISETLAKRIWQHDNPIGSRDPSDHRLTLRDQPARSRNLPCRTLYSDFRCAWSRTVPCMACGSHGSNRGSKSRIDCR